MFKLCDSSGDGFRRIDGPGNRWEAHLLPLQRRCMLHSHGYAGLGQRLNNWQRLVSGHAFHLHKRWINDMDRRRACAAPGHTSTTASPASLVLGVLTAQAPFEGRLLGPGSGPGLRGRLMVRLPHRQTGISRKPGFPRISPRMLALDYNKKAWPPTSLYKNDGFRNA